LGSVTNAREGVAWLRYTYLAVRMAKNPLAYGISYEQLLVSVLGGLIHGCVILGGLNKVVDRCNTYGVGSMRHAGLLNTFCPLVSTPCFCSPRSHCGGVQADPTLNSHSKDLVTAAARQLSAAKMAVFDERSGAMYVTELGRVASHFYIRHGLLNVQLYGIYTELLSTVWAGGRGCVTDAGKAGIA
jgi:hypothetical protein